MSQKDVKAKPIIDQQKAMRELLASASPVVIGARLRRARRSIGLSIRDLAALALVSKNSIVRIEQGGTPNSMTVLKLCEALGIHVASLAKPSKKESETFAVHRAEDDRWYELSDFGSGVLAGLDRPLTEKERRELVRRGARVPLLILKSRLDAGKLLPTVVELYSPSDVRSHAGEEFAFVLKGDAIITVGGRPVKLGEGESVTFWSAEEHIYAPAQGSSLPVRILSVRLDDKAKS